MEHRALQISEDLDGAEKLIKVTGKAGFGALLLCIWKQVDMWLLPRRLWREAGIVCEPSVADEPTDSRDYCNNEEESGQQISIVAHKSKFPSTYTVVAFRVKVRLVEAMMNSHEGRVIVANVRVQYSKSGMAFNTNRMKRANKLPHVAVSDGTTSLAAAEPSFARAVAARSPTLAVVGTEFIVLGVIVVIAEVTVEVIASTTLVAGNERDDMVNECARRLQCLVYGVVGTDRRWGRAVIMNLEGLVLDRPRSDVTCHQIDHSYNLGT